MNNNLNNADREYILAAQDILLNGVTKSDRTGVGTISKMGITMRFDLSEGFPLLTTKKVNFKAILYELLWFLSGDNNVKYLIDNGVDIWTANSLDYFNKSNNTNLSMDEFKNQLNYNQYIGDCGRIYGCQWRDYNGKTDQIKWLIEEIKRNPDSRRLIVNAWNPTEVLQGNMALPPCHILFQCESHIENGERILSLDYIMRSNDFFLGAPFNIASYALLTHILAKLTNHKVGVLVAHVVDAHIYTNHIEQIKKQIENANVNICYDSPKILIDGEINIDNIKQCVSAFKLMGYNSHPSIKATMAV